MLTTTCKLPVLHDGIGMQNGGCSFYNVLVNVANIVILRCVLSLKLLLTKAHSSCSSLRSI